VARQKEALAATHIEAPAEKLTETWVDKMMKLPSSQRKCRYMITGEVGRKICPNAYECGSCSFDRMMQTRIQAEPLPVAVESHDGGFGLAPDMYYHEGHAWAKPEYGGRVRVGLDDFARKLLGKLSRVDMPEPGQEVKQGEAAFGVRRNGDAAQVLSPVDGVVSRVNHAILENPDLIHESPYKDGWLFMVEPSKLRKNLKGLYYGEEARTYLSEERELLFSKFNEDMRVAADGGESVEDISSELKGEEWSKFVKTFLRS
jgi:glycine cleavage system H lipoate-binding protein